MKFNAKTAREVTTANIETKKTSRIVKAKEAVDKIIVPLIEEAISKCSYEVFIKKAVLDDYSVADCYDVLKENGFAVTNYNGEFLVKW